MNFIDLFAGLGGFHLAVSSLGGKCVFASEINEKLQKAYEANFNLRPVGDITKVDLKAIPAHDILCAGFPCQPFSKAGDQLGWRDAIRGTLFFNITQILEYHRPEYVVLENVANFLWHDNGNTYRKVEEALRSFGYDVKQKRLSPHQFGIPQDRERVFIVGKQGSLGNFKWPLPESNLRSLDIRSALDERPADAKKIPPQVIDCLNTWQNFIKKFPKDEELPSFPIWSMEFGSTYPYSLDSLFDIDISELRKFRGSFGRSLFGLSIDEIIKVIPSYARKQKDCFPKWKQQFILKNRTLYKKHNTLIDPWIHEITRFPSSFQKLEWNCKGEERDIWKYIIQLRPSGVRVKRTHVSPSLVAMTVTQVPIIAWENRYMTARECARLQSMDNLSTIPEGGAGLQALGNAVNVKVARLVIEALLDSTNHIERELDQAVPLQFSEQLYLPGQSEERST